LRFPFCHPERAHQHDNQFLPRRTQQPIQSRGSTKPRRAIKPSKIRDVNFTVPARVRAAVVPAIRRETPEGSSLLPDEIVFTVHVREVGRNPSFGIRSRHRHAPAALNLINVSN
jgi:hypothetical protein